MDTLVVVIDYPQADKDTTVESFEKSYFLNKYKTLRLVVYEQSTSIKIKLENIIFNLSIELSVTAFRELISKLKEICNINIKCPWAMNQENDHVRISLVPRHNYRSYRNVIVLDDECIYNLLDARNIFTSQIVYLI